MNNSILSKNLYIKENIEYISLLSLENPSGLSVINKALFDFLLDPKKFLDENKNINISQIGQIINPLLKKNLIDTNNPFLEILEIENTNEPKTKKKTISTWIHLTNQCNLDCSYCYIGKDESRMSIEVMDKTIESLKTTIKLEGIERIGFSFAGGEPLMNFNLLKLFIEKINSEIEIEKNFSIVTNGTLLNETNIDFLNKHNFSMYISLDGLGKDNDVQRYFKGGEGSFDKVISGINKVEKLFKGKFTIGIVVSPENVEGLPKLTEFLLEKGIQFKYSFYRPNENSHIDNYIFENFQDNLIKSLNESFKIIKEKANSKFNPEKIFDKISISGGGIKQVCTMGKTYFAISHLGEISSCHMTQGENLFKIEIDSNIIKTLTEIPNKIHKITANDLDCYDCTLINICRGGCRLVIDEQTKKSIYHKTYIELFDQYIDLISSLQWKYKK